MLKKILALILLIGSFILYGKSNDFLGNKNLIMVINGKSSGEFVEYKNFLNYDGIFTTVDKDFNYEKFAKNLDAKFVKSEDLNGCKNLYFYTNKLPKREIINGKAVNLHVAISQDKISIGTPIIYGGY